MQPYNGQTSSLTANANIFGLTVPAPCVLAEMRVAVRIAAPNDASNYWQMVLRNVAGTLTVNADTSLLAAASWSLIVKTALGLAVADADAMLYMGIVKVGAPGALSIMAPSLAIE